VFDSNGRRDVTTTAINTQEFKSLQFDLVYGDGVNGQPANGFPVSLEYATEKGGPWKTLQAYTMPGQWTRFHVNLSPQDQDSEAYFRWDQNNNFSAGTHAWALDNIAFNNDFFQHPASVDFSNGLNDGIFGDITNGKVKESFVLGRTKSLVFDSNGRRDVTTTAINTQEFKSLQFDLVYGDGVNGQPANGFPVSLEYATEKGGPWKTLQTYTLPGQWTRFHVNLSPQDQDSEAYFRWGQNNNFSAGTHAWALDNIAFNKDFFQHPTNVDFSDGLNDGLFGNISNAKVADAFAGRSKSLTFTGGGARFVDTTAIDTRKYRALEFDLIYGNGSNGGAANAFPIALEYSTNNGTTWTPLKTFVNSGVWNREIVELPIAAQQEATLLRWDQNITTSTGTHVWAVDNIRLKTDTKPPALTGMAIQGNRLQLTFTEPVVFTELTSDRFSVTVGSSTREVTSITSGSARSEVLLTLSGAQPLSSEQVRLTYADPVGNDSEGVIEDDFGNDLRSIAAPGRLADTFTAAASVTSLAVSYARLNLIGPDDLTGIGHSGANTITGNAGDNLLDGLGGKDQVVGGPGADKFRFSTPLNARTNQDRIIDFNPRQGDKILLENAVFTKLSSVGRLSADAFVLGAAKTAGHRILYDPNSGALSYDSNGSLAGAATVFASLPKGLELSSSSFVVI
jgi:Ca2+-binding RTX toxin-like protein